MSTSNQPKSPTVRHDGWTTERQLRFLDALARTHSVSEAAKLAGMSRESAYRLRERRDGALFAALWDRILEPRPSEVHNQPLTEGRLMRLLGNHYRRERGDFAGFGSRGGDGSRPDRTQPL